MNFAILEVLVILRFLTDWATQKAKDEGYTQADLDAADAKREEAVKKLLETNGNESFDAPTGTR